MEDGANTHDLATQQYPLIRPSGTFSREEAREKADVVAFSRFFQREKVPKGDEGPPEDLLPLQRVLDDLLQVFTAIWFHDDETFLEAWFVLVDHGTLGVT